MHYCLDKSLFPENTISNTEPGRQLMVTKNGSGSPDLQSVTGSGGPE